MLPACGGAALITSGLWGQSTTAGTLCGWWVVNVMIGAIYQSYTVLIHGPKRQRVTKGNPSRVTATWEEDVQQPKSAKMSDYYVYMHNAQGGVTHRACMLRVCRFGFNHIAAGVSRFGARPKQVFKRHISICSIAKAQKHSTARVSEGLNPLYATRRVACAPCMYEALV